MQILFETERLIGGTWDPERHAEAALEIYGDPEVTRTIGGETVPDVATLVARMRKALPIYEEWGEPYAWVPLFRRPVSGTEHGALVGAGLLKPLPDANREPTDAIEVGWHLARAHWGHGYATEAGRALIHRGFAHLDVDVLHAVVDPGNHRSCAVAERCGMRHVGQTSRWYGKTLEHFEIRRPRG